MIRRILKLCVVSLLNILCFPAACLVNPGGRRKGKCFRTMLQFRWEVFEEEKTFQKPPPVSQTERVWRERSRSLIAILCLEPPLWLGCSTFARAAASVHPRQDDFDDHHDDHANGDADNAFYIQGDLIVSSYRLGKGFPRAGCSTASERWTRWWWCWSEDDS